LAKARAYYGAHQGLQAATSVALLVVVPFVIWDGFPNPTVSEIAKHIELVWTSLLHCSMYPVAISALFMGVLHGRQKRRQQLQRLLQSSASASSSRSASPPPPPAFQRTAGTVPPPPSTLRKSKASSKHNSKTSNSNSSAAVTYATGSVVMVFTLLIVILSQLQVIFPSWAWNPFVWYNFVIYPPTGIQSALQGLCVDPDAYYKNPKMPLCLSEASWSTLSSGVLSSKSHQDVATVLKGVDYARDHKIIMAVMSRDTVDAIPVLRQNVEGWSPFFKDMAVVVFENDSHDGSRQAFKEWSAAAEGYKVDLMGCGTDNPDCEYHMSHRYDSTESKDYFTSSAIGKMADFRQKIVDYVKADPKYFDYSHMVVVDIDLQVSFSPLGLMHTLGLDLAEDYAIASTGRQTWPGSMGTLTPQYDFSAFRAIETPNNRRLHAYHRAFCGLLPPGDRWRNQCDAISPMHLFLVLDHEHHGGESPYAVESAFNGATLYPMSLIRSTQAKYDAGDDLQRCEHIGFNLSLKRHMYVNPKWDFHLMPTNPGGPTGIRALKNVFRIVFVPRLSLVIFFQNFICMSIFAYSWVTIGAFLVTANFRRSAYAKSSSKRRGGPGARYHQQLAVLPSHVSVGVGGGGASSGGGGGRRGDSSPESVTTSSSASSMLLMATNSSGSDSHSNGGSGLSKDL
jgi:hypothetical protein